MGPVEEALGLSRAQASLGFSLAILAEGLLAYPVGRWIDRGHERLVMTGGSLLAGACLLLHGLVATLWGFYAVWLGLGAAMAGVLYSPAFAVVTRRFPQDYRRAIITMTFLGGLASTVFIPFTSWLIAAWGWRMAIASLAAWQLLLCAPLHAWMLRGAPPRMPRIAKLAGAKPVNVRSLMRSPPFLLIGLFVMALLSVSVALPAHMISLLREYGVKETWVVVLPASIGVIQVLGRLLLYFFEHRFDLHLANRVIPLLIPMGLVALLLAPLAGPASAWVVLGFVVLYGMGNGMLTIVRGTAIAQYVSKEHAATLNGALGLPLALARASAPLLLGVLWNPQVGYTHGLWLLLAMSAVGVVALVGAQHLALVQD
ncbi:MFS transporter [Rhodoferax aquaticus]|uniref:MFS transporter n=2 Tax=Rhodoferax aquaticus TaxID=2527691 RepID=A0A515EVB4_9BURK|nr:MFS transporter [Rhodoferax aquaticus]